MMVILWWIILAMGFVKGPGNPLKAVLPASQLPAYGTAVDAANGESTYDYPWNMLPIPPGLPLPDRPLNEYLPQ